MFLLNEVYLLFNVRVPTTNSIWSWSNYAAANWSTTKCPFSNLGTSDARAAEPISTPSLVVPSSLLEEVRSPRHVMRKDSSKVRDRRQHVEPQPCTESWWDDILFVFLEIYYYRCEIMNEIFKQFIAILSFHCKPDHPINLLLYWTLQCWSYNIILLTYKYYSTTICTRPSTIIPSF